MKGSSLLFVSRIALAVFMCVVLMDPRVAVSAEIKHRCHMCGMDSAKSQTEFVVHLSNGGSEHTCCLHCVYLLSIFIKDRAFSGIEARDFISGDLVKADDAHYLEGSSLIPKGSMAPFIFTFRDSEVAEKHKKRYGGSIIDFKKAMEIVALFDAEVR